MPATQFLPQYAAFTTSVLGPGEKHRSWKLQLIGVLPAFTRKGIARNLIQEKVHLFPVTAYRSPTSLLQIGHIKENICVEAVTEVNVRCTACRSKQKY